MKPFAGPSSHDLLLVRRRQLRRFGRRRRRRCALLCSYCGCISSIALRGRRRGTAASAHSHRYHDAHVAHVGGLCSVGSGAGCRAHHQRRRYRSAPRRALPTSRHSYNAAGMPGSSHQSRRSAAVYSGAARSASLCVLIKPSMSNANGCAWVEGHLLTGAVQADGQVDQAADIQKAMPKCVPFLVKKISRRSVSSPQPMMSPYRSVGRTARRARSRRSGASYPWSGWENKFQGERK